MLCDLVNQMKSSGIFSRHEALTPYAMCGEACSNMHLLTSFALLAPYTIIEDTQPLFKLYSAQTVGKTRFHAS